MLIYFGGIRQTSNGTYTGEPMDQIRIFDIASQRFYTQSTSGTPPAMRRRFCGGAAWAQDRSSYNMYVDNTSILGSQLTLRSYFYGGIVPPDQQGLGFNDVWILSIPSFTWVNVCHRRSSGLPGPYADYVQYYNGSQYEHHSSSCSVINGAQMIVMGGYFPNSTNGGCDSPLTAGQHNLDLSRYPLSASNTLV
jgi:hypothetical protein